MRTTKFRRRFLLSLCLVSLSCVVSLPSAQGQLMGSGAFAPVGIPSAAYNSIGNGPPAAYMPWIMGLSLGSGACNLTSAALQIHSANKMQDFGDELDHKVRENTIRAGTKYYEDIDEGRRTNYNKKLYAGLAKGGMCQMFVDKDGKEGDWAKYVYGSMVGKESTFLDMNPSDVELVCPKFKSFDKAERKLFWLKFFATLAHPESTCIPTNDNHNAPNGTAFGLFQLENKSCVKVGFDYNGSDLHDPGKNTMCAVAMFASELKRRGSIFSNCSSHCSKGEVPTYWGELRSNPAAVDSKAAGKFVAAIRDTPECN